MHNIQSSTASRIMSFASGGNSEQPRMVLVLGANRNKLSTLQAEVDKRELVFVNTDANKESYWTDKVLEAAKANPDKPLVVVIDDFDRLSPSNFSKVAALFSSQKVPNSRTGKQTTIANQLIIMMSVNIKADDWVGSHQSKSIRSDLMNRSMTFELKD